MVNDPMECIDHDPRWVDMQGAACLSHHMKDAEGMIAQVIWTAWSYCSRRQLIMIVPMSAGECEFVHEKGMKDADHPK